MSSYSVAVEVCTRTNLIVALLVLTIICNGIPNMNFLILMIFLSSIVPLPTKPTICAIQFFIPRIFVVLRFWLKASLWLTTLLLHPFLVVLNFLIFSLLEEGLHFVVYNIRNANRLLTSTVVGYGLRLFFVQFEIMICFLRIVSSTYEYMGVILTVLRYIRSIASRFLTVIRHSLMFSWVEKKLYETVRIVVRRLLMLSLVVLVFPGPVAVGNYVVTGHFHPGSVLRFKSWLIQEPEPLFKYSSFLDNCFSSWTALRTAHFFVITQILAYTSWTPTTHITKLRHSFTSWSSVAMVTSGGTVLVTLSSNFIICQVLHVGVAAGSLAMFLLVLDGYHKSHFLLTVYGLGTLLVITQDALVVAYEVVVTISSIQSTDLSLVAVGCLTLWTCWTISIDVCGRIARKIINPSKSIL